MWNVYQIVNRVSGRKYYGIAKNTRLRWNAHKHSALTARKKSPLYDSIRSYGLDQFEMEVLHTGLSPEEAGHIEIGLIAADTTCYNLHLGGKIGFDIRLLSEDRQKQWKAKLSEKRAGRTPALGMTHTDENKKLFSQVAREYWESRKTYTWEDMKELSFIEAHTKFGISKTHYYRLRKRDKSNDLI